ncbi:MAG: RNA methyltransferase [Planctomycetales bacterium]|nr:RNA methyltransferase [Planctomycetales bacterium]
MRETITSLQNTRVKAAVRLRERRARQQQNLTLIDGIREIERALSAGVDIQQAFVSEEHQLDLEALVNRLDQHGAEPVLVTARVFEKIAFGNRGEGIVVTASPPQRSLADLPQAGDAVIGVVEAVEKPGNIGAIVRSADAAGVSGLIFADPRTDLYNPNAIRSSLGVIFSIPVCAATTIEAKSWLLETKTQIYVARVDGAVDYTTANLSERAAIVLGSEANGVSEAWRDDAVSGIKLPMLGMGDSLNVSVTAGILFYEALRQRTR